jgi:hypothetical protein
MDRYSHPKHYATFIPAKPPVDCYLRGCNENVEHYPILDTGISRPIYDLNGNIHFSLPLEDWPPENDYHREVYLMRQRAQDPRKYPPTNMRK